MSKSTKTIQNLGCICRFDFELNFGYFWEVVTRVVRNHYKNPEKNTSHMMTQLKGTLLTRLVHSEVVQV